MPADPIIRVENLVFEYPTARALHGVSLAVPAGAIAALVGPNGAGKTTLLRCLAALDPPFSGHVTVSGLDVTLHPRDVHRRLGYLPDFYGLYDELTVEQCLLFAARSRGITPVEADTAAQETAALVDLSDRLDAKAETLSRGLRQRLAIGQAIVHRPEVVLLDEPASGLDPEARRRLSALCRRLQGEGMTLVVSSHILAELEDYCSHMIVMDEGRIVGTGAVTADAVAPEADIRVRIGVAGPEPKLRAFLAQVDGVRVLEVEDTAALITMPAGVEGRAALLAQLMTEGFAIAEFAVERKRLEDAYFEEMGGKSGEGAE